MFIVSARKARAVRSKASSRRLLRLCASGCVYLTVIAGAVSMATLRTGAQDRLALQIAQPESAAAEPAPKPYFSLSTNRTYGTSDRARIWINYQGVDHLDFRVYRIKDPVKFFTQLNDPHRMGEQEKTEVTALHQGKPSALEKIRAFKSSVFSAIKNYFRRQLKRESRETFNQKLRGEGDRLPLNVADYARVPLLNPDQLVGSWRQMLSPPENVWDSRMVMLGKREAGVYLVEAVNGDLRAYTIAVVTDLTLLTKTAPAGEMLVYAVHRKSGSPREGARVMVAKGKRMLSAGATDRDGIVRTGVEVERPALPRQQREDDDPEAGRSDVGRDSYLVMAMKDDDFAINDLEPLYFGWYESYDEESDYENGQGEAIKGYIYTDRPVYRPAQKVFLKGILRRLSDSGYQMVDGGTAGVTVEDPNNGKLFEKDLTLSSRGAFSGEVELPAGAPLGSYRIVARVGRVAVSGYFEVQEYKKPEYRVTVSAPKRFVPVGDTVKFSVEARYFFGAPVTTADVQYYIYRSRYYHWWWHDEESDVLGEGGETEEEGDFYGYGNDIVDEGNGSLDDKGRLEVDFKIPEPEENDRWDYTYRLEAQVTDASRRTIDGRASVVGTRGNVVAMAQADRYVYYEGDTAKVRVRAADYEGRPVSIRVTLKFVERKWDRTEISEEDGKYKRYEYKLRERELASADVTTNDQGDATYEYRAPIVGSIEIKTIAHDGKKEVASMGGYLWVADRSNQWADFAYEDYGSIKLVPDKKSYAPGETAHVLAMLPTDKAHLLVTTELGGVMTARRVESAGPAIIIDVPIEARYAPNVYLSVSYVKDGEMYTHDKLLIVPAKDKFLTIDILADKKEYKPRDTAVYTLLARNHDGTPASGAEVSLGVVDEAIYSIRPDQAGDIRKAFYGRRYNQVQTHFSTSYSFSGYSGDKPVNLARNKASYQLADFKNEGQYAEPTIRKDFRDTTFWKPDVVTGPDGKATVSVKLPDNLTTWRATARAVTSDTRVGSSVGKVVARKDLILRLETPRFLTEGDTVTLSAIVHNYLEADKSAKVSLEVAGVRLLNQAVHTVAIKKQGEQRIDWQVAALQAGQVRLLAKALTDTESDAVEIPMEVIPHGLRKTAGAAVSISDEAAEETMSLDLPANANGTARMLRIEASPSVAATLFGALDYLTSYPYGCTEQTMSGFLPNVVVAQALKDIRTASIRASNELGKKVQRGLDRLYDYQHGDGGWGWWKDDKSDPFMTAYVVDGLVMAERAGYQIDRGRIDRARASLNRMIDSGRTDSGRPLDVETRAYMVYALAQSGGVGANYVNELFAKRGELQPYGRALLALALKLGRDEGRARQVASDIENTARATEFDAHWESRRRPMLDLTEVNDIEATALSLKALAQIAPESRLLSRSARWLVSNRRNGYYWDSTKQTAFAIFGLIDYLKVSKELAPDYVLEIYLNDRQVFARNVTAADASGAQPFVVERRAGDVADSNRIRFVKRGRGVLHFSATVDYFTREGEVAAQASPELRVTREYLRLRVVEGANGARWSVEPLSGEVRSGDMIVSRLRLEGARAQYLMIEDPIPAGCEQVERASGINLDYSERDWTDWYNTREFRDQKTVLFLDYFDGRAMFQYALRVQIPGEFRVAPARAELMYRPTIQSNTASSRMGIKDR